MNRPRSGSRALKAGDLGRRIAQRRRAAGLSRLQLAERAGIAAGYVEYLETDAEAAVGLTSSALARLASALQTTVADLAGGGRSAPPGGGGPGVEPRLLELSEAECWDLLAAGGVGRIAFQLEGELLVLPVNYALSGHDVVFQTAASSPLIRVPEADTASFEVDNVDEASREGWSVLLRGRAELVTDADQVRALAAIHRGAWAGPDRNTFVRFRAAAATGRRIQTRW